MAVYVEVVSVTVTVTLPTAVVALDAPASVAVLYTSKVSESVADPVGTE